MPLDSNIPADGIWRIQDLLHLQTVEPSKLTAITGKIKRIDTRDALLTLPRLRETLQRIDLILALGGDLVVLCRDTSDKPKRRRRTGTQIQYEIGCVFPDCYRLASRTEGSLEFKKIRASRPWSSGRPECSLGYITDGKNLDMIRRSLEVLETQVTGLGPSEILVAGPESALRPLRENFPQIKCVGDFQHDDVRGPINRKKALIIDAATRENLLLAHDRFFFDSTFWTRLNDYGNYFDFYNCRHCAVDRAPHEVEVSGGYGYHRPPISGFSYAARSGSCEKHESNPHFYNNGGLYIGKSSWFRGGRWPGHLHWGDLEDVHFTRRCELDGAVWAHDWGNRVFTTTRRMGLVRSPRVDQKLRAHLRDCVSRAFFRARHGEDEVR